MPIIYPRAGAYVPGVPYIVLYRPIFNNISVPALTFEIKLSKLIVSEKY
jgi:hypothetical protein